MTETDERILRTFLRFSSIIGFSALAVLVLGQDSFPIPKEIADKLLLIIGIILFIDLGIMVIIGGPDAINVRIINDKEER